MAQRRLFVFAHVSQTWAPAGRLSLTQTLHELEASSFAYGTRYLERADALEVDPVSLGLADKARVRGVELFPVNQLSQFGGIRDAAPDAWGRRVLEAQARVPANTLSEADYLLGTGSDRVGALDVRESLVSPPQPGAAPIRSLAYLQEASERIEQGLPVPSRLTDVFAAGSTAGGARPKASVRDETGVLWLAKFAAAGDAFDMAQAECSTLQLARRCGLTVPELRVHDLGGKPVLLVQRFDRIAEGQTERRLPFASGLTLVACDEWTSRTKGYADLAQAIRQHVSPSHIRADTQELFARMVFNIFVSNDDDHLRNHGFMRDPQLAGWRLSPLYDVVPRPSAAFERHLHLQVGQQGKLATLDNALSDFSAFTPHRATALAIVQRIWLELRQWRSTFEETGANGRLIDQLAPAMRALSDIASPGLQAEIRHTSSSFA